MNTERENNDNFHELFHLLSRKDEELVPAFTGIWEKAVSKRETNGVKSFFSFILHPSSFLLHPSRTVRLLTFASTAFLISAAVMMVFRSGRSTRVDSFEAFFNWSSPTVSLLRATEYGKSPSASFNYARVTLHDWRSPTASLLIVGLWDLGNEAMEKNHNL